MLKPRLWKSRGEWVCGHYGRHLEWATGETPTQALRHWMLGQVARLKALGRFGGGRYGQ